jgi:hypothetical protein
VVRGSEIRSWELEVGRWEFCRNPQFLTPNSQDDCAEFGSLTVFTITEHRGTEAPRQNRNEFLGVSVSRWYVAVKFALGSWKLGVGSFAETPNSQLPIPKTTAPNFRSLGVGGWALGVLPKPPIPNSRFPRRLRRIFAPWELEVGRWELYLLSYTFLSFTLRTA